MYLLFCMLFWIKTGKQINVNGKYCNSDCCTTVIPYTRTFSVPSAPPAVCSECNWEAQGWEKILHHWLSSRWFYGSSSRYMLIIIFHVHHTTMSLILCLHSLFVGAYSHSNLDKWGTAKAICQTKTTMSKSNWQVSTQGSDRIVNKWWKECLK